MVEELSVQARAAIAGAISASTRASYGTAVAHYRRWCEQRGFSSEIAQVTVTRACNWLANVGAERQLMHRSLGVYRAALSTAWVESQAGPNPLSHHHVTRVLVGYGKGRVVADLATRDARTSTLELTVELLAELSQIAEPGFDATADAVMLWAAACTAVFGLHRCIELFGSTRGNIRLGICRTDVHFYRLATSVTSMPVIEERKGMPPPCTPDHYTLHLGATKADQMATNERVKVAAGAAVTALYRWYCLQGQLMHEWSSTGRGPYEGVLFQIPGQPALARTRLFAEIGKWCQRVHGGERPPKITGKTFRRGGNQTLLASGASGQLAQTMGRWASKAMPLTYSSLSANAARSLIASRGMGQIYEETRTAAARTTSRQL